jgi:hypothetical protein
MARKTRKTRKTKRKVGGSRVLTAFGSISPIYLDPNVGTSPRMSIKRTPRETRIYKNMNEFKKSVLPEIQKVKSYFDNQQPLFSAYLTTFAFGESQKDEKKRMMEEIDDVYENLHNLKDRTTRLADIDNAEQEKQEILSGIKYVHWKISKLVDQINFRNVSSIAVSKNGRISNLPR